MSSASMRVDQLAPEERRAYLAQLLQERKEKLKSFPLSYAQQRLWFLDQLTPGQSIYNVPAAVKLEGKLEIGALEQALSELVRRHESLRTTFMMAGDEPVQVIGEAKAVKLEVEGLSGLGESEREAEARMLATEEANRAFNLTTGPLLRVRLLKLDAEDHVLMFTMHHIVSDGWSMGVLTRELGVLYEAYSRGQRSPLEELKIQYPDYAVWQRERLRGEVLERMLNYWKKQLGGAPPVLELPVDHSRPPVRSGRGARLEVAIAEEVVTGLKELSQKGGVTLFAVLLAAWQVLLSRYSGQDDIVIGTPIAGRVRAETEKLIGFFVNTLALRTDLSGNPTFLELLRRVKEVTLEAYAHQELPFEKLVEELHLERDLSRTPLFQAMLVLQNMPKPEAGMELSKVRLKSLSGREEQVVKFDLTLDLSESGGRLNGAIHYSTDLFEAETIRRMSGHFGMLLAGAIRNPLQRITELPLLTEAEQRQLREWNQTERDYPWKGSLHRQIEEQVKVSPDAIAVASGEEAITYEELNKRANKLAHHLRAIGVGLEIIVGICIERSIEMVVGILGVLKAGGAYLPLELNYPPDRQAYMLQDVSAPALLTQQKVLPRLPKHEAKTICLDGDWGLLESESEADPEPLTFPLNLAYVIYTSGSTGRPKAASNSLSGVDNRLAWMQETYRIGPSDRVLQKAPFGFDVSVWEFFWPLLNGACLVMAKPDGHRDSQYLVWNTIREQITVLHFVPSMLQFFVEEPEIAECRSLRQVFCSGEELSPDLCQKFQSLSDAELHNLYGPTEAAVDVTYWRCRQNADRVPIGGPIANTQAYVLDEVGNQVPIGIHGELYIGGRGVGRGYFKRPELTAEKFVPDEFGKQIGAILYRTGDRVRWLADGTLEFFGRIDFQVKLRGNRIELGEIESVLTEHAGVQQSVVVLRDDSLVAYIVGQVNPDYLRMKLKSRLPDYMVPSQYVLLERLPLTPNGKVDRKALPSPELNSQPHRHYVEPNTDLEHKIAAIWREVLRLDRISIHDNFFDVGGHSLALLAVQNRLRRVGGYQVPVVKLFQFPTVASLSTYLSAYLDGSHVYEPRNEIVDKESQDRAAIRKEKLALRKQMRQSSPLSPSFTGKVD